MCVTEFVTRLPVLPACTVVLTGLPGCDVLPIAAGCVAFGELLDGLGLLLVLLLIAPEGLLDDELGVFVGIFIPTGTVLLSVEPELEGIDDLGDSLLKDEPVV